MPPAAAVAGGTLGAGLLGDIFTNGQNKANQQNATNATNSARQADAKALQTALSGLQGYEQQNPSPVAGLGVSGPSAMYGGNTMSGQPGTQVGGSNGGAIVPAVGGAATGLGAPTSGQQSLAQILATLTNPGASTAGISPAPPSLYMPSGGMNSVRPISRGIGSV